MKKNDSLVIMAWAWTCFCHTRQLEEKCQGHGNLVIRAFQRKPFNGDYWEAQLGLLVVFEASGFGRMVGSKDAVELEEANIFLVFGGRSGRLTGGPLTVWNKEYEKGGRKKLECFISVVNNHTICN